VINITEFRAFPQAAVRLWKTPHMCGPAAAKEKIAATF